QIAFAVRAKPFSMAGFCRLDACYPNEMPAPATRLPIGTIATARDSWSRVVPLPRLRAPGQQQAQASALPRPPAAMLPVGPCRNGLLFLRNRLLRRHRLQVHV